MSKAPKIRAAESNSKFQQDNLLPSDATNTSQVSNVVGHTCIAWRLRAMLWVHVQSELACHTQHIRFGLWSSQSTSLRSLSQVSSPNSLTLIDGHGAKTNKKQS